jgi:VCBS repeat-containing protein
MMIKLPKLLKRTTLMFRTVSALILAAALGVGVVNVLAVHNTGTFELDGNSVDPNPAVAPDDFDTIFAGPGGSIARAFLIDSAEPDNSTFGLGIKDTQPASAWSCDRDANPQQKTNILNAYAAAYSIGGNLHVFFGADRETNTGNANFGFWFFQNPLTCDPRPVAQGGTAGAFTGHKTHGDLLIVSEFTVGGTVSTVKVFKWTDPTPLFPENGDECLGNGIDCSPANKEVPFATGIDCQAANPDSINPNVCATVNTTVFNAAWRSGLPERTYYEGGVNLGANQCFTSFMAETRSSQSLDADLKDFASGDLNTCGSITINKDTVPNDPQDFSYTGAGSGGFNFGGGFSLDDDTDPTLPNTKTFSNLLPGTYTVSEGVVAGFPLTSLTCVDPSGDTTTSLATRTASIALAFGETVTCTFASVNNPPVANNDNYTTGEDSILIVGSALGVLSNDIDLDGNVLTVATPRPVSGPFNGTLTLNVDGSFTYTPNVNFFGIDSFTYRAQDSRGAQSNLATVTINVTAVNDAPVAGNDNKTTAEDTPLTFPASDLTANDSPGPANESTQMLTVTAVSSPSTQGGTVSLSAGNITYSPAANFFGADSFTYTVCDNGVPSLCAAATVNVTVTAVNDLPVAGNDAATVAEDSGPNAINVLANDFPGPANESTQTLTITTVTQGTNGSVAITGGGTGLTYTPNANFFGNDSFTYTACDNGSPLLCATATVNVTVTAVNDAPVAGNDNKTTAEDTPLTFPASDLTANDSPGPANESTQMLTVTAVSSPSTQGGTVSLSAGNITYSPAANFFGADSFTYTVCDNGVPSLCAAATVNVTVTSVADITTVAGTGVAGFLGDGGAATSARLNFPTGVAVGGSFYIADRNNHRVRRVDNDNPAKIITVAGTGTAGFNGDNIVATAAQLNFPTGVAVDAAGNLYIADSNSHRIRKVVPGPDGIVNGGPGETITTVAGTGNPGVAVNGGSATAANLWHPRGVAVDVGGNILIADSINQQIRKVAGGIITAFAGTGLPGSGGDGGAATAAKLNSPIGVAVDAVGNVYIADEGNNRIRRVSGGNIATVAGGGAALGDGGLATNAKLRGPSGVAVDGAGNFFIADLGHNRVRRVDGATQTITTVAGTGVACPIPTNSCGDGGPATAAQLRAPSGVAVDATGNIFIADQQNHRVRKVEP